ncbi:MAG: hypothetical protein HN884_01835 [Rhodospirillaceae bacterium]|nr:hypothetical protein [Rhodospirillaceae bacterium]MBT7265587.1 hypothetical protein [Rhodospirillaceae bacterium]
MPDEFYQRRGGFSIFDFWKRPGWRLGTGSDVKGPLWYLAVVASFALGIWAAWADIIGGAGAIRIAIIWIVVSGVAFYFLIRLQQTLLWGAVLTAASAALTLVLQLRFWLLNDTWPGWLAQELPILSDIVGAQPTGLLAWLGNQSAIFVLLGASIICLALTLITKNLPTSK